MSNKLIIAAAGSGKTTYLVKQALEIRDERVLITTFTDANEREIISKFIAINGCVPPNVTIQTWFSFLLQHGVRPYQSVIYEGHINGLYLVSQKSGYKTTFKGRPIYFGEKDLPQYYFTNSMWIYSDKIAKFVCRANELTTGLVLDRLSRIFTHVFIDEIQDLAGYDLELVKLLLLSRSNILMVGDPRQVTYHTHDEAKYKKYSDGRIEDFITAECKKCSVEIDKELLSISYRNKKDICELANQIYPDFPPCEYQEQEPTDHDGVYFVKPEDVNTYLEKYKPIQLRENVKVAVNLDYDVINFGESKGLTYDRVLIYPTKPMLDWICDHSKEMKAQSRSKLYVAITRARHSVAIVFDNKKKIAVEGVKEFNANECSI